MEKNVALILAAGKGTRMGQGKEKAFLPLAGKPLLAWTLFAFEAFSRIHELIVVVPPNCEEECRKEVIVPYGISKAKVVSGGNERQDSIQNGFAEIEGLCNLVIIHDGARPFVTQALLEKTLDAAEQTGAAVVAVPVKDTIKIVDEGGMVQKTLDRSCLWAVQTPQAYRYSIIKQALEEAKRGNFYGTDDASLVERLGKPVQIVTGSYENIKVTSPEDLVFGEIILRKRTGKNLIREGT